MKHYWMDRPIDESMSKEELLEIIDFLASEVQTQRKRADDYMKHVDFASYLLDPARKNEHPN